MFLPLKSVHNIRELGGIKTKEGFVVKSNLLFRSATLTYLEKEELEILENVYHIKYIVDFRSLNSFTHKRDKVDDNIKLFHLPTLPFLEVEPYNHEITVTPQFFFKRVYRSLATYSESHKAYHDFFQCVLKASDGGILWHCTSGKDRTGIACALLLRVLGCSMETIYEEHMRTNEYNQRLYDEALAELGTYDEKERNFQEVNYLAKMEFLEAYLEEVNNRFGGIDNFISNVIGVTEEEKKILKDRYLCQPNE